MLMKVLCVLTALALSFQRLSMAVGSLCWGLSIAISLYLLWQQYKSGELQKLIQENEPYAKHLRLLGILTVVMLWGVLFTDNIGYSFKEYLEMWIYRPFPFIISALVIRNKKYLRIILLAFGLALCADCFVAAYQYFVLKQIGWGFGGHHNNLGSITAVVIPMLVILLFDGHLNKNDKKVGLLFLLSIIVGCIYSVSRGAWLTLGCVLPFVVLYYALQDKKKLILVLLVFGCVVAIFMTSDIMSKRMNSIGNTQTNYSNIGRFHMWNISMYMVKDHPLGIGTGRYASRYTNDYDPIYTTPKDAQHLNHPHNNYIKVWVENGPLGILTYLYVCGALLVYNFRNWLRSRSPYVFMIVCGWLSYMIYGLFDVIVDHSAVTKIWWFLLGALLTLELHHNLEGERP